MSSQNSDSILSKIIPSEIPPLDLSLSAELQKKIDQKTKPIGALGNLETLAHRIGLIQNTLNPSLNNPHLLVFAGDHGITEEGVSAYPKEVTWQMVQNFLQGGAAINVFCHQHDIQLHVIDAGVDHDFDTQSPHFFSNKTKKGTQNFLQEPAMTLEECKKNLQLGAQLIPTLHQAGCNVIGFGEMGIGNTSASSIIMSRLCDIPIEQCVGKGTGLTSDQLQQKTTLLQRALDQHPTVATPFEVLQTFAGLEMVQLCGAMLKAASLRMIIIIDGFITSTAYLIASRLSPHIHDYAVFSHVSQEKGHLTLLHELKASPLLNLSLRLGEGTGCALAYPLLVSAINFLNEMASFESATVSQKNLGS